MRRIATGAAEIQEGLRARLAEWDGAFGLHPEEKFFEGWKEIPPFEFTGDEFSPVTAWWLAELCRLSYTPDHREVLKDKNAQMPRRGKLLPERSPFVEELSIHKWGNHASIYRMHDGSGPTVVCFRGTKRTRQWIMNAVVRPHRWRRFRLADDPETAFVHSGFYVILKRLWPKLNATLHCLPRPWIFTGHSLGGALATLAGALEQPDLVCTFGAPKVGNADFYSLRSAAACWRFVNAKDLVPRLPLRDDRLGARQFVHGYASRFLTAEGKLDRFESLEEEGALPFTRASLSKEIIRPPSWIVDHRIGEYCRKLRQVVSTTVAD